LRKELPVLESIGTTKLTFNSTLSKSKMEQNEMIILFNGETVTNSTGTGSRPLQGQSNMIINTELSFTTHHNFQIAAAFNNFSKRLVSLGSGNVADEYEYPFPSLNLTARKNFESFSVKIKLINLLDSSIRFGQIEPGGKLRLTNTYQPGRQISINVEYQYK
ncbi:MAG: hypothetical protein ACE5D7_10665, partial [Fidelibacterota bacterium]